MKGFAIKNLKVIPGGDGSATSRKYVDRKLGTKVDRNDLNGYLKLDGTNQMSSNLRMNGKRIVGLTNVPAYDGEATNKKYVDTQLNDKANNNDLNDYLKLDGTSQMQGNLQMNNNRITRLPLPNLGDEAATKNYVTITMNQVVIILHLLAQISCTPPYKTPVISLSFLYHNFRSISVTFYLSLPTFA